MRTEALAKYQAARERFETLVSNPNDLGQFHALTGVFNAY